MPFAFSDLIVPEVVRDMVMLRVSQQSPYLGSGAASYVEDPSGGNFIARRLRDEDLERAAVIDGNTSHAASIIGAARDYTPVLRRTRHRMIVDGSTAAEGRLAAGLNEEVVSQSASYWQREIDDAFGAVIAALFDSSAGCLRSTHKSTVATSSAPFVPLSYAAVVGAATLAGDSIADYNAVVMHSRQWADVQRENAAKATFLPLGGSAPVPFLGSLRVIISDGVPTSGSGTSKKYTAILLRPGALFCVVQQPLKEFTVPDTSIPALKIAETLHFGVGAEGCRWIVTDDNPSNVGLSTAASWAKSAPTPTADSDKRSIGLVGLETNAV